MKPNPEFIQDLISQEAAARELALSELIEEGDVPSHVDGEAVKAEDYAQEINDSWADANNIQWDNFPGLAATDATAWADAVAEEMNAAADGDYSPAGWAVSLAAHMMREAQAQEAAAAREREAGRLRITEQLYRDFLVIDARPLRALVDELIAAVEAGGDGGLQVSLLELALPGLRATQRKLSAEMGLLKSLGAWPPGP